MINEETLNYFKLLPEKIIVTVHKAPDYDAIGSLLAMGALLKYLGRDATLYSPDINIKQLKHLPGIKKIIRIPKSEYDLGIFLDCSDQSRISHPNDFPNTTKIMNIDHHQDNTHFGDINVVHNISSVGEILFNLFIMSIMSDFLYLDITFNGLNILFTFNSLLSYSS